MRILGLYAILFLLISSQSKADLSLLPDSYYQNMRESLIQESYQEYNNERVFITINNDLEEALDGYNIDKLDENHLVYSTRTWNEIDEDKQKHVIAGVLINGVIYTFAKYQLGLDDQESYALGVLGATLIGALKEAYDATGRGTVDFEDFTHTVGGGAFLNLNLEYKF